VVLTRKGGALPGSDRGFKNLLLPLLGVTAGIGLSLSPFLEWVGITTGTIGVGGGNPIPGSIRGLDGPEGLIVAVGGALVLIGSLAWLGSGRGRGLNGAMITAGGLASLAIEGYVLLGLNNWFLDRAAEAGSGAGITSFNVRSLVSRLLESESVTIEAGLGVYVGMAAAAVGLLVGILALAGQELGRRGPVAASQLPGTAHS
jgi:hypothetical protein